MIRSYDGFVQEAMSYKPVDRTQVRTRDITLSDGQAYDIYMDPFTIAARKMVDEVNNYELKGQ